MRAAVFMVRCVLNVSFVAFQLRNRYVRLVLHLIVCICVFVRGLCTSRYGDTPPGLLGC